MNNACVVVGAGLPGIAAALALAERGQRCVLLEAAPEIGGLLRSYDVDGYTYDFGTHFANHTGVADLDRLLFGGSEGDWKDYPFLAAGNFWNGKLNEGSDNPDLNSLSRESHYRCLGELLSAPGWHGPGDPENAEEFLVAEYGQSLVNLFFDPVLEKLTGKRAGALHHRANLLFNLKRFAVLDEFATGELKKSERFDSRVAFHHRNGFKGHRPCLYPRAGGIGCWIEQLEEKLKSAGVEVKTNARIERVDVSTGRVTALSVDGGTIGTEALFWSAAPAIFCRLAGMNVVTPRPEFRSTVLAGLVFDRKFASECHYVTVLDPELSAFRVTLYENFRTPKRDCYGASVEFMVAPDGIGARDWARVAEDEMRVMGLCEDGAVLKSQHVKVVPTGFPVQSNESVASLVELAREARRFGNVHLIGRAGGEGWFLDGLIRQSYELAAAVAG